MVDIFNTFCSNFKKGLCLFLTRVSFPPRDKFPQEIATLTPTAKQPRLWSPPSITNHLKIQEIEANTHFWKNKLNMHKCW